MLDKTTGLTDAQVDLRKPTDLLFPLAFTAIAGIVTLVWLAAIGWLIWQPLAFLAAWLFA